ncbi:MAG TPA: DUF4038 domain-containing protein [Terriglobales bacterium]|nr:DUF4038 domain-containing protein [Terriglobales bacterium]
MKIALRVAAAVVLVAVAAIAQGTSPAPRLKVSTDGRWLQYSAGVPSSIYLGNTAWEIFARLTREQADLYLAKPRRQGIHRDPGQRAGGREHGGRSQCVRRQAAD